ncbi:metal-dependent transcriptional regulator, partial [Streptomyces sp. SID10244]|nr:metal-dependent transcriptional regulator [Streptomyces sp. SID10244]
MSPVSQGYLQAIWCAREWHDVGVTTKHLADRLGVSCSTVSETVRKLTANGYTVHPRYGSVDLTDAGCTAALQIVRRHRLLKCFLARELGYTWDEIDDE